MRCDVPAHVYQSTFDPNTQWSEEFAQGKEILEYWRSTARKHNTYQYIQFHRQVQQLVWSEEDATWTLHLLDVQTGKEIQEQFDFVISAVGHFNAWKLPEYPGIQDYRGHLRHSSHWDPNFNPRDKKVALIGNGASGVQLLPELQQLASHVDHYARNKTYIAPALAGKERSRLPVYFSEEQKSFFQDPETYLSFRKEVETSYFRRFESFFKDSALNKALKDDIEKAMARRLEKRPDLLDYLRPDFSPHCRRLTPGPGYLEALMEDNVSLVRQPIERFTETGIVTTDGVERSYDAIICATGANIDFSPPFPIIANGVNLQTAWRPGGHFGFPASYLGLAAPLFPNLLFLNGPQASGPSGTQLHTVETQTTYVANVLRKVSKQRIRTIRPSQAAVDDFTAYSEAFFPRTVMTEYCQSWANGGNPTGRIHGYWPGSASHVAQVRREPRWEDWEYTYRSPSGNRFAFFGNGWTKKELEEESDLTPYLKVPDQIDLRAYHENWFDI